MVRYKWDEIIKHTNNFSIQTEFDNVLNSVYIDFDICLVFKNKIPIFLNGIFVDLYQNWFIRDFIKIYKNLIIIIFIIFFFFLRRINYNMLFILIMFTQILTSRFKQSIYWDLFSSECTNSVSLGSLIILIDLIVWFIVDLSTIFKWPK